VSIVRDWWEGKFKKPKKIFPGDEK